MKLQEPIEFWHSLTVCCSVVLRVAPADAFDLLRSLAVLFHCIYKNTRILTESERKTIAKYLRKDGEKEAAVREIVYRSKKHLAQIDADLRLLRELLAAYERNKTK